MTDADTELTAARERIAELEAELSLLRAATKTVHDTFKRDIEQGYVTKDKSYAVEILGMALGRDEPPTA